jgi:hypothetical protein
MVENISTYLYVHHVCFKFMTSMCKKTHGIHEIKDFVWVFNEPIKLVSLWCMQQIHIQKEYELNTFVPSCK